jgi:hypothetical protein
LLISPSPSVPYIGLGGDNNGRIGSGTKSIPWSGMT